MPNSPAFKLALQQNNLPVDDKDGKYPVALDWFTKGWEARQADVDGWKGKRLCIAEDKFAAYFPQERPLAGAQLIAWDESGNLLGIGFGCDNCKSGIAIIVNGKKYDSSHVIHWRYSPATTDDEAITNG